MANLICIAELRIEVWVACRKISAVRESGIGAEVVIEWPSHPSAIAELNAILLFKIKRKVRTGKQVDIIAGILFLCFFQCGGNVCPLSP